MKNRHLWIIGISVVLISILFILLGSPDNTNTPQETSPSSPTQETEPTEPEPTETQPQNTEPAHSALYIPGLSVENVITYFCEVCLDSEFTDGGDPTVIQKWISPIYYSLNGDYTDKDLAVLTEFASWLNTIEGFPGISQSTSNDTTNLQIHFCTPQKLSDLMGEAYAGSDGAVIFWYYDDNVIYDEIICYRKDIDQHTRNSVILEEIYNGLGPVQDTLLREDSIIYQYFTTPQALTAVDELILRLLYHPDIQPGMNRAQCVQIIRQIYY